MMKDLLTDLFTDYAQPLFTLIILLACVGGLSIVLGFFAIIALAIQSMF